MRIYKKIIDFIDNNLLLFILSLIMFILFIFFLIDRQNVMLIRVMLISVLWFIVFVATIIKKIVLFKKG